MTFETAKVFIDKLLTDQYDLITTKTKKGLIIEFIGGEPFLMIDLVSQISDYIWESMIKLNHPWLLFSRISISSNGILYFEPKV
jgi:sulfatase maturation enzyme AslB (radical SAM superfamily)